MNSRKKIFAGILSFTLVVFSGGGVFASDSKEINAKDDNAAKELTPISEEKQSQFHAFTGEIKEIRERQKETDMYYLSVKNSANQPVTIVITKDTFLLGDGEIEEGSIITSYYDRDAPMLMIYPPQYSAEVVVIEDKNEKMETIKVDLFDENLVSSDQSLKLHLSDETKIILKNGEVFEGDVRNRNLAVIYHVSTRSIPAQTTPIKIIVLSEKKVSNSDDTAMNMDVLSMDLKVNGKKIEAPNAYMNEKGTIMVPVRAIAEALGYDVHWEDKTKTVRLGNAVFFSIGQDDYTYMKTAPIQLGTAPTIIEERTFVPLRFFQDVAGVKNVYVDKGQIFIDDSR